MKKYFVLVSVIVLIVLVIILFNLRLGETQNIVAQKESAPSKIVVTDVIGRNVSLPYPVKRIVVTDDEVAELVELMGASNKVVGIEPSIKKRGYFPEMSDKPVVGSQFRGLNYELIAKLKPDVVIMMDTGPIGEIIDKLNKIGVKSIVISIKPQKIPETLRILGKIFGNERRAEELIKWWSSKWDELEKKLSVLKDNRSLKVFVGMGFRPTNKLPLRTWGKYAKWNYILEKLHMVNIAAKVLEKSGDIDIEYLIKENPDIIIVGDWSDNWLGYNKNTTRLAQEMCKYILSDPALKDVKAVKEKRVYIMHYILLGSFRSVIGAYYLAKAVYPNLMKDVNPEELHKEYFENLLGVPYRGVWFYSCGE